MEMFQVPELSLASFRWTPEQPALNSCRQWTSNQRKKLRLLSTSLRSTIMSWSYRVNFVNYYDREYTEPTFGSVFTLVRKILHTLGEIWLFLFCTIFSLLASFSSSSFDTWNTQSPTTRFTPTDWLTVTEEWHSGWFGRRRLQRAMRWVDCFRQLAITGTIQPKNNQKLHKNKHEKYSKKNKISRKVTACVSLLDNACGQK